ncbi:peptide-methionine (S)-S-oxide reductase MsrA [Candidatus Woesearchaeota archaeon]|nr:peptide-methionine (S)-S-oxide reductase MsrA [Candidatus Woesearchaeota archaeon]
MAKLRLEKATFAAGCFWHVEAMFRQIKGITSTQVGYSGGEMPNPTYEDVCSSHTGHAESVEVTFDPEKVSYEKLLDIFWNNHDPTQVNRQGPDIGSQYRSVIFYNSAKQKAAAMKSKQQLQKSLKYKNRKIATEIIAAKTFYRAEEYHQQYLEKRGLSTCRM